MSIEIDEFSGYLPEFSDGMSGTEVKDNLIALPGKVEAALNLLSSRIAAANTKTAVIRKNAPMDAGVTKGMLVYWNPGRGYAPAQALLRGTPGSQGESVEAEQARVVGIVLSLDAMHGLNNDTALGDTGTVMLGGYWEDSVVASVCFGEHSGDTGTFYLSPYEAGKAVMESDLEESTVEHLRQPIMTNYGNGAFSLGMFYMAHDNHFHGSMRLTSSVGTWTASEDGYVFVPDTSLAAWANIGELSARTAALFKDGLLADPAELYVDDDGNVVSVGSALPADGSVVLFNSYPFSYDNPVVRNIAPGNDALTVTNKNGLVTLTQNDFTAAAPSPAAAAVSGISGRTLSMTPVVSLIVAGLGVSVEPVPLVPGGVRVSATSILGAPMDAYSINNNGTLVSSDGSFTYYVFPSGRAAASLLFSFPITWNAEGDSLTAIPWVIGIGTGASFSVSGYFVPMSATAEAASLGEAVTLALPTSTSFKYVEASGGFPVSGNGLLSCTLQIASAPGDDIRLLRLGIVVRNA